jgi:hypothetical protein
MKKIFFIIGLIGLFTSCVTVGTLSYDRLQAADVNFPEQVRSIGIVNNMPPSGMTGNRSADVLEGDGKVMAESFAQAIATTEYFDRVVVCDSSLCTSASLATGTEGLLPAQVDSLTQALGVDMLFSLNRVTIELKENSFFVPGLPAPISVIDGIITPVVQVYVSGRNTPLFSVSKSDSIYWEVTPTLSVEQVVKESSEFAASIPMKHLLPYWEEMTRFYFDGGNAEIRDAAIYVREEDWDAAAELWRSVYGQKKGKCRIHAAFNLALYHEMKDEFELALAYLDEAFKLSEEGTSERAFIQYYQMQLQEQAKKNKNLQIQMNRFE